MAVLFSAATGDFLTAASWGLVDATSYNNSESASTALTTSYQASNGSTTGVITVDGIALKLAARNGTTGTMSVHLAIAGVEVSGTLVTIDTADLPAATTTTLDGGWIYFKFATPVILVGATSYTVEAKTSSSSQVTLYSSSGTNWARALRTTTTQAPVAGDDMIVAGEHTGAGTGNNFVVTMNETAATDYGNATTSEVTPALAVCKRGTLKFNDASAGNPYLRVSGHAIVYNGGALNDGTVATPIPRDSTSIFEFDCALDGAFGLSVRNGGTYTSQGLSRTSGKDVFMCLMTADASASGGAPSTSTISVDTDTGWLSGDMVAVASTTRTADQCECGTLNANAGASSMVVKDMIAAAAGAAVPPTSNRGLINAHSGTSPAQAEIVLVTRNVRLRSVSTTAVTFVKNYNGSIVDIDWSEFYYTGDFRFNVLGTAAWNFSLQYSSIHTTENEVVVINALTQTITELTISNNVLWSTGNSFWIAGAITATNYTISGNIAIRNRSGQTSFLIGDVGGTWTNNRAIGSSGGGFSFNETDGVLGTLSGNIVHSCGGSGFGIATGASGDLGTITSWRNADNGFYSSGRFDGLSMQPTMFGNNGDCIMFQSNFANVTINSPVLNGDTTFATTRGLRLGSLNGSGTYIITIKNGDFSTVSGIKTALTEDISVEATLAYYAVVMHNTKLGGATQVASPSNMTKPSYISAQKLGQVAGAHKTWTKYGTLATDTVVYNTASPSMVMTPTSATLKLESAPMGHGVLVPVLSGATITAAVSIRKTATYNGNQPRLIVRENVAIGIAADTVLATYSSGTGSWNQISGTTATVTDDGVLEFIVDCDGTVGAVNFDDFDFGSDGAASIKFWFNGVPTADGSDGGAPPGGGGAHFSATIF